MTVPNTFKGFAYNEKKWNELRKVEFEPKKINPEDVVIKIEACGLCGSDIHTLKGDWGEVSRKDLVVGHEIVGKVVQVGNDVKNVKVGQIAGIGAQCNSCLHCDRCLNDYENYCTEMVPTYNKADPLSDNYITQGGYANYAICNEHYVFPMPKEISPSEAAPLLCGGLTVFAPLTRSLGYDMTGKKVGIVGIGGLGHMAIIFAHALGAEVTAISRSSAKRLDALKMGAKSFIATGENENWTTEYADKFDLVLNCAANYSSLDFNSLALIIKFKGELIIVGAPSLEEGLEILAFPIILKKITILGSVVGSRKDALKMIEIVDKHKVKPWVEEIPINSENIASSLERCDRSDIKYRFVFTDFDKEFQ